MGVYPDTNHNKQLGAQEESKLETHICESPCLNHTKAEAPGRDGQRGYLCIGQPSTRRMSQKMSPPEKPEIDQKGLAGKDVREAQREKVLGSN